MVEVWDLPGYRTKALENATLLCANTSYTSEVFDYGKMLEPTITSEIERGSH